MVCIHEDYRPSPRKTGHRCGYKRSGNKHMRATGISLTHLSKDQNGTNTTDDNLKSIFFKENI